LSWKHEFKYSEFKEIKAGSVQLVSGLLWGRLEAKKDRTTLKGLVSNKKKGKDR
jgi:putative sterol carrier protein